jgi:hypothetical protein
MLRLYNVDPILDIKPSTGEDSYSNLFPPMKAEKQKL